MAVSVNFQNVSNFQEIPESKLLKKWILSALGNRCTEAEITLRVVDRVEMIQLNTCYRGKTQPTNVLSFTLEDFPLIGDIVICAPVVFEEAQIQKKELKAHWAHLTVHGVLHLLGYDHVQEDEAESMEALEVKILKDLNFSNPYEE